MTEQAAKTEQTDIATPRDLREHADSLYGDMAKRPTLYPWEARMHARFHALADRLDALRQAVPTIQSALNLAYQLQSSRDGKRRFRSARTAISTLTTPSDA